MRYNRNARTFSLETKTISPIEKSDPVEAIKFRMARMDVKKLRLDRGFYEILYFLNYQIVGLLLKYFL